MVEELLTSELERLRDELAEHERRAADRERQIKRFAADLRHTFKREREQAQAVRDSWVATVRVLVNAVEARDAYTGRHAERVAAYGMELAGAMDPELTDDPQMEFGFLLHDVGKVGISDSILHKPGPLTESEWALMRRHTVLGSQIISEISFLSKANEVVRSHHERWDGRGYPDGLVREEIPLPARIFAVADTLDAITTERPYRPAASMPAARDEIALESGAQFDPLVVEALQEISLDRLERIRSGAVAQAA
jgi:HD-GYP domain-containing protein (c-di-GMP phosphodiesterase class II)